ncbi:hypothetical protein V7149_10485 [Bacillus sp. JJ1503]|uniref:hypothetical protein n=1 Tax=Bacillus sp. JJ1503 TaxID=3122956 RepID=UPI002FFE484D
MSRKERYQPLPQRVVNLAKLLDKFETESNMKRPYNVGFRNGLETALGLMEMREVVLKPIPKFYKIIILKIAKYCGFK